MTNDIDRPEVSALEETVYEIYRELAREVAIHENDTASTVPDRFDVGPVHESLELPLQLWQSGRKPTRTVPTLLMYESVLGRDEFDEVVRLLVGLDAFVTMLDEFIDSVDAERHRRTKIAINVAFSSLLAFSSIPNRTQDAVVDALTAYLVEASRIPAVEQEIEHALADATGNEQELIRASYEFRARDIAVFGTLPALVAGLDRDVSERITADLQTYRARCLLFDDVEDVEEDRQSEVETPVTWLLDHDDDIDSVVTRVETIRDSFEYSDADYATALSDLEPEWDDLADELTSSASHTR